MRRAAVACLACAACLLAGGAGAATFRVDDSGTSLAEPVLAMRWRQPAPGRHGDHTVASSTQVFLRLNLAPWLSRQGRIYMVLAATPGEPVLARWQTQGRLLPGAVQTGQRALVYEGAIHDGLQAETLLLTLEADGRQLSQVQTLQFHFEIDVLR